MTCWVSLGGTCEFVSVFVLCLDLPTVVRLSRIGCILSCRSSSSKFLRLHSSTPGRLILPGFLSSSRRLPGCPPFARFPVPALRSVLRLSHPLDGLLHPANLWACFIPLPRPGFSAVQGFLLLPSRSDSSSFRAPLSFSALRSPASRLPFRAPATSRPLSLEQCVPGGWCLAFRSVAPLFGFPPPSGPCFRGVNPVPRAIRPRRSLAGSSGHRSTL